MNYKDLKEKSKEDFRRLTGIFPTTFEKMVKILAVSYQKKHARGGRNPKLDIEHSLLMALEYLREYRTYFHIAHSYGISESAAYKTIRWVEDTLIKEGTFSLPGKKDLTNHSPDDILLIDATESPVERPKKSRKNIRPLSKPIICSENKAFRASQHSVHEVHEQRSTEKLLFAAHRMQFRKRSNRTRKSFNPTHR